jgi:hypothetical protein
MRFPVLLLWNLLLGFHFADVSNTRPIAIQQNFCNDFPLNINLNDALLKLKYLYSQYFQFSINFPHQTMQNGNKNISLDAIDQMDDPMLLDKEIDRVSNNLCIGKCSALISNF